MKNILWCLGFLSFLSLLYFINGNTGFLGFLGFIPYFTTYWASDERLEINTGRASRNAFLYVMIASAAGIALIALTRDPGLFYPAFAVLFAGSLIIYVLSFLYYDRRG